MAQSACDICELNTSAELKKLGDNAGTIIQLPLQGIPIQVRAQYLMRLQD